ncbi:hypothetical protein [Nocardiopsis sp. NRRL B-16309]|uniref:hypothetical protein n=1 Tax=Nocardiopsis sp. NRRL B-16309 TaxID=1519494 RepID=UPI0006B05CA7|nr:hypothetical protein [Nocardiopsis sp. NRRL B-16309]KOX24105.1 hypothetical protein ADL05_00420 [Nocardiopsis sp. NRRL B-16309]
MTCVCDIGELSDVRSLYRWAAEHGCRVGYLGADLQNQAVYGATRGPHTRVARDPGSDPHPRALVWQSPLEHLEAGA